MNRKGKLWRSVALGAAIVAGAVAVVVLNRPVPTPLRALPEHQRAAAAKLAELGNPDLSPLDRLRVLNAARPELAGLPEKERVAVAVNTVVFAAANPLLRLSELPENQRRARIAAICGNARKTYQVFKSLSPEQQGEIVKVLSGPQGRVSFELMNDTLTAGLTPADRRALGPAIHVWHRMLTGK